MFSSTISIGGIFAASSLGEGIADSLHLDLLVEVAVVVGVVATAVVVLVVLEPAADDCSNIFIIPSLGFD